MGGGGKGGSNNSKAEIPEWLKKQAIETFNLAREQGQMGYMPYMGPDVAAAAPQALQAMDQSQAWSNAFGMGGQNLSPDQQALLMQTPGALSGASNYLPQEQQFAGGIRAYSSYPAFNQSVEAWRGAYPGQAEYYGQFFIDPVTGQPANYFLPPPPPPPRRVYNSWMSRGGEGSDNAAERGGADRGGMGGGGGGGMGPGGGPGGQSAGSDPNGPR